jgi:serine/threonine-protein kinase
MEHASPPPSTVSGRTLADGPQPGALDLTGRTLDGFKLLRCLGQGGMGQVYLAEQISLKRKVALKLLRAELAADKVALQRFKSEAQSVARATHANIVQVYATGEADGLHYMALEFVEGRNLRQYLEKKGPPEVLLTLSIIRQVASALQRASELGIIHRDIKPENILLTRKGEVKVADFGLSRCFAADTQPLNITQSGVTMGTPLYMSPEQVEGKAVDPRTDIYSFGVTCYHLLAGQPPFVGSSPFEVALQHVQKEPEPLVKVRPDLPPELCALVHKMMAKKPEDRFQTGREIAREASRLRDAVVGVTGAVPNASLISVGPVPPQPGDAVTTQTIPRPGRGRRLRWAVAASILLALGGGLLFGWWRNRADAPAPTADVLPGRGDNPFRRGSVEAKLLEHVKETAKPEKNALAISSGLDARIKLGLFYLNDRERRLPDALKFFKELEQAPVRQYQTLGMLGEAMVLAFEDKARESMELFRRAFPEKALGKLPRPGQGFFWFNHGPLREMMAEALDRNRANLPPSFTFPPTLEALRRPPTPIARKGGKG